MDRLVSLEKLAKVGCVGLNTRTITRILVELDSNSGDRQRLDKIVHLRVGFAI